MGFASTKQKCQDWFTQQWAIFWGKRIDPLAVPWLLGPVGSLGVIADNFVEGIAEQEGLVVERNATGQGLIPSMQDLQLPEAEFARLSPAIVDFYENTGRYRLAFRVQWNPWFKIFGKLVNALFSHRIGQLTIPSNRTAGSEQINSELITLTDPGTGKVKYTVWYRTFQSTGQVLYSGVYSTCTLPSGEVCVKAVFPLPNGNATVLLSPSVGPDGGLRLASSGKKFGDPGFYFVLTDAKGQLWSQYIRSFRDQLDVRCYEGNLRAEQTLTLWHRCVLRFHYSIHLAGQEAAGSTLPKLDREGIG
ncbi:hypothetical protein I2I05_21105 [Hymenobacter sp. BT683]|uniref:Uncharacterized protein n=1 Tax=Hymenobacter jeongseonensis TaxID=2791027 RepID=A0ABS0INF8_9BACT|nr:hypothetical protein [Hymenobacter jeongseonensis]MBF9239904.1 hypothetical protein [Hymenobacter jeongseonensis]